jgi:copper(I)-binding protein
MLTNSSIYIKKVLIFLLSLILLTFSKADAKNEDVIISINGLIFKNPQIVYKDVNAKMVVGYFELENTNNFDDKLISVKGDISSKIEIHNTKMHDGVMKMYKIDNGINIEKKTSLNFEPGKYHLMIIGVNKKITDKEYLLSLYFQKSKKIDLNFKSISTKNKLKMAHSH